MTPPLPFQYHSRMMSATWKDLFAGRRELLKTGEGAAVFRQYELFSAGSAPKVVDPKIKEIPIYENGEELIDLKTIFDPRIGMMPNPVKPFGSPDCNSGLANASKLRQGIFLRLEKMADALDVLAPSFGFEAGQIGIKIFEGLRDLSTQKTLYDRKLAEILSLSPELSLEEAHQETCKWVSPVENNIPVHSTGAAVDIRLWDNYSRAFLDLGPFGVIWGPNPHAPTFSEGIARSQKLNRLYGAMSAARAGLTNYFYEYWHFSSGDRYDAWFHQKPHAIYHSAILKPSVHRVN